MEKSNMLSLACHALLTAQLSYELAESSLMADRPGQPNEDDFKANDLKISHRNLSSSLQRSVFGNSDTEDELSYLCQNCDRLGQELLRFLRTDDGDFVEVSSDVRRLNTDQSSVKLEAGQTDALEPRGSRKLFLRSAKEQSSLYRDMINEKISIHLAKSRVPYQKETQSEVSRNLGLRDKEIIMEVIEKRMLIQDSKIEQIGVLTRKIRGLEDIIKDLNIRMPSTKKPASEATEKYSNTYDSDEEDFRSLDESEEQVPLFKAVNDGNLARLRAALRSTPAAVDDIEKSSGRNALHIASAKGHRDCVAVLLERAARVDEADHLLGMTALHYAVQHKHPAVVRLLLEKSASKDLRNNKYRTPLEDADKNSEIEFMLENGWRLTARNDDNLDAINFFANQGSVDAVSSLLAQGAKVDSPSEDGKSPLALAARNGHLKVMKILVRNGANVNRQNDLQNSILSIAAAHNKAGAVEFLIENGADPSSLNVYGFNAFHDACRHGRLDIARVLLQHGADIYSADGEGHIPLNRACREGRPKVVKLLLSQGADPNWMEKGTRTKSALMEAARMNRLECVRMCLEHGADPNLKQEKGYCYVALHLAALHGHANIVSELIKHPKTDLTIANLHGFTALHESAKHDKSGVTEVLLAHSFPLNLCTKIGETALQLAARDNRLKSLKLLIEHKADSNTFDNERRSPLIEAAMNGHTEAVRQLLKGGATADVKNREGHSALNRACMRGQFDVVQILVNDAGADIDQKDNGKWTPLMQAAHWGRPKVVEFLISKGANLEARHDRGKNAYEMAEAMHQEAIATMISEAMAREK